jgi:hypothetical protein
MTFDKNSSNSPWRSQPTTPLMRAKNHLLMPVEKLTRFI